VRQALRLPQQTIAALVAMIVNALAAGTKKFGPQLN
jgi:hypothetical protein